MTRFQRGFCVLLCICFFGVLAVMPEPFSSFGNLYRQLPLFRYLEKAALQEKSREDTETSELIAKNNGTYLAGLVRKENEEAGSEENGAEAPSSAAEVSGQSQKADAALETAGGLENPTEPQTESELQMESELQTELEPQMESENQADSEPQTESEDQTVSEEQMVSEVQTASETQIAAENSAAPETQAAQAAALIQTEPHPTLDLSTENLADLDFVLRNFYVADENTTADAAPIDAVKFLSQDMTMQQDASLPQILIYHSHSQETFADSREGETEDTVVGVGNYLTELLTEAYGYNVIHITDTFDIIDGVLDRSGAYDNARQTVEQVLAENPSIEVVIDLHRDGVPEGRRLVTEINGKETAQIMFYNGLSYTLSAGEVTYLPNPYIEDNLAFSFQLEYQAALYYPEFYRCIYLAGLRYNLHLRPKAILLEAGAQTNTVQEVKNAMEPFADILNRVLTGMNEK